MTDAAAPFVRFESPFTPRPCPWCGELATAHRWHYDVEQPEGPRDDRKPVSEAYEHASKPPCERRPAP